MADANTAEHRVAAAARDARLALEEAHASGDAARCESAAACACSLVCAHGADSAACDALAWELLHALAGPAEASPGAGQHCAELLAALAAGCPPRDALPLFLEALQLSLERRSGDDNVDGDDGDDAPPPLRLRFRAALARGVCALLGRVPRRRWEAALNAAPQMLRAASSAARAAASFPDDDDGGADAADAAEERAASAEALEAALSFASAAAAAADVNPEPAVAPALLRLQLRTLAAAATKLPRGAADARLAPLRASLLCAHNGGGGGVSWAVLDAAATQPARPSRDSDDSDVDDDDDGDAAEAATRAAEAADAATGAALLAAALLCTPGGDALRGADALQRAVPHASLLLSGAAGPAAMHAGAALAGAAARATSAGSGACSAATLQPLLASLAAALARAAAPSTREAAHAAMLRCLDALSPWARLEAVRSLLATGRDPPAAALLFRRMKADAGAHWPAPPLGAAPAARLLADWLADVAHEGGGHEALAEAADATIGALNALRFMLLRDAAGRSNVCGLAAGAAGEELRTRTLTPLRAAAAAAAAALQAEQHTGAMLAAQTVQEVCECVLDAAEAAQAAAVADDGRPAVYGAGNDAEPAKTAGLRAGFLR